MALKFFRRYSRVGLLLFMVVLMVVFVIGDAIGRRAGADRYDETIGEAFGEPVRLSDLTRAQTDFNAAAALGVRPPGLRAPQLIGETDGDIRLGICLLLREAEQMGIAFSEDRVRDLLQQNGVTDQAFDQVQRGTNLSRAGVYQAVGRLLGLGLLYQIQLEAVVGETIPHLQRSYRDRNQTAKVVLSVIDSSVWRGKIEPSSEEELTDHFNEGKNRDDEHTEEALHFGYRLPDRVKIEYLTVDPKEIEMLVRITEKESRRYYEENKDKYRKPAEGPLALDAGQAAVQQSYEEVRDRVREAVRSVKAIEEAQKHVNAIWREARKPWDRAPRGADGRRAAPDPAETASFEALRARFSETYGVKYGPETAWLDADGLSALDEIGGAAATIEQQRLTFAEVALNVEGIAGEGAADVLRVGEPAPVVLNYRFTAAAGGSVPYQAFLFRVTAVEPSGPPAGLEAVRDEVIENVALLKAHAAAGAYAQKLAERAREVGLRAAVAEADDLKAILAEADAAQEVPEGAASSTARADLLAPYELPAFERSGGIVRDNILSAALHERIFELADGNEQPDGREIVVVSVAEGTKWIVAELEELKPLYDGEFQDRREQLEQEARFLQEFEFMKLWCNIDNIRARANYVDLRPTSQ